MENENVVKKMNPNLKVGEIIDGRFKVVFYKEISPQDDLRSGGEGKVIDLLDQNRVLDIVDMYDSNWSEPKKYEKIVKLAPLINKATAPFLTGDLFVWHNEVLYRIAITCHESNEIHDHYSLYKRICHRIEIKQKFTEEEITEFIYWAIKIRKHMNSVGLDSRARINHGNFKYIDGKIMYRLYYFDVTDKMDYYKNSQPPYNINGDYLWLLGGIIYEMASLKIENNNGPFFDMDDKMLANYQWAKKKGLKKPRLPELPSGYSPELVELYERLIEVVPENRPTMDEILSMDVMKSAHDSRPNPNWSSQYDSMGIGMMLLYYDANDGQIKIRKSNERVKDPFNPINSKGASKPALLVQEIQPQPSDKKSSSSLCKIL